MGRRLHPIPPESKKYPTDLRKMDHHHWSYSDDGEGWEKVD